MGGVGWLVVLGWLAGGVGWLVVWAAGWHGLLAGWHGDKAIRFDCY